MHFIRSEHVNFGGSLAHVYASGRYDINFAKSSDLANINGPNPKHVKFQGDKILASVKKRVLDDTYLLYILQL